MNSCLSDAAFLRGEGSIKMGSKALERLRRYALGFAETREDHPWGESAIKVRGKTFVFLGGEKGGLHLSLKLPQSKEFALEYPFTKPTPYGLGKSGWVSASFAAGEAPPFDILEAWIAESYRAIAPKTLLKSLPQDGAAEPKKPAARTKRGNGTRSSLTRQVGSRRPRGKMGPA